MIALRGPSTSYDLKRAVGHSVGYFWKFPHTQLYDEPARLAEAGLLTVEKEEDGRRRRVYSITPHGLEALRQWLREPTSEHFEIRDAAELKLFYSELVEPEDIVRLAREQIRIHEHRLREYETIERRFQHRPELAVRMAPLNLGLELERTALRFWRRVEEQPPGQKGDRPMSAPTVHVPHENAPSPKAP